MNRQETESLLLDLAKQLECKNLTVAKRAYLTNEKKRFERILSSFTTKLLNRMVK